MPQNKKTIFISIPKTGSTSICNILFYSSQLENRKTKAKKHAFFRQMNVGDKNEKYIFSFVRNPWDHAYSMYRSHKKNGDKQTFEHFVFKGIHENHWTKSYAKQKEFKGFHDWLINSDGVLVPDFIGRFENIEEDFKKVLKHLGIKASLKNLNQNNKYNKNYKEFYTKGMIDEIGKIYERDIEYFGYTFEDKCVNKEKGELELTEKQL